MSTEKANPDSFSADQWSALIDFLAGQQAPTANATAQKLETRIDALEAQITLLSKTLADVQTRLSTMPGHTMQRELATLLTDRLCLFKTPQSPIKFDILCFSGDDPTTLTRRDLYLDKETLERHYDEAARKIGAIPANKAIRFVKNVSVRLTRRIALRIVDRVALPLDPLIEALLAKLYQELVRFIPARHLARRLAATANGLPVLLPLNSLDVVYLDSANMDPFYLAAALMRAKLPVCFVCTDEAITAAARTQGELIVSFQPDDKTWAVPGPSDAPPTPPPPGGRPALVGGGIRGIGYVLRKVENPVKFHSPTVIDPAFGAADHAVFERTSLPVVLSVPFRRQQIDGKLAEKADLFCGSLPHGDLADFLATVLAGVINQAIAHTRTVVQSLGISEAHICEHPLMESAILAHVVRENGGKVFLWPHAWGPPSFPTYVRPQNSVSKIYCVDKPAAETWRAQLPGVAVDIVSNLYMPRYVGPRRVSEDEFLNVVLVGNERHFCRTPLLDWKPLEAVTKRLFRALDRLPADVQWTSLPRSTIDLKWQWALADWAPSFRYTRLPPVLIDLPNMLWLFPALLSSALVEGIGRGIPCLVMREDFGIEDYLYDEIPDCVPHGDIAFVMAEIERCRDPAYRQRLVEKQVAWYETQTHWDESAPCAAG